MNAVFAGALQEAGLHSWIGDAAADASWLSARFADVYPHETAISHVRRLLAQKFVCTRIGETMGQFRNRMAKVEAHMNSPEFADKNGEGLLGLCKSLRARCQEVKDGDGRRIRH